MNGKLKAISLMVLARLGITAFTEDKGKVVLTEDQSTKIKAAFGEPFLEKFKADLAKEPDQVTSEDVNEMVSAITHFNSETTAKIVLQNEQLQNTVKLQGTQLAEAIGKIDLLSKDPETEPVVKLDADLPRKADVQTVLKVSQLKMPVYAEVNHFIKTGTMNQVEAATIDVADLASEFGTYLSQNRNNLEIVTTLFQGFTSAEYFTSAMGTTEWRGTQDLITSVSQQFTPKWTPSGNYKMRPLTIRNRRHKINYPIIPAEVLESYAMYMYDEGLAIDQMPITKYIWGKLIYPQLLQDIEWRMIWKGKFVDAGEVAEGDAGKAPEDSMDGVETILVDNKAANAKKINYFDGEGFNYLTASDEEVLKFVDDFIKWLSPLFRIQAMNIHCSYEFWRRYRMAYKNKWGAGSGTEKTNFGSNQIDFSIQTLVPVDGMYGSPILFTTPKMNMKKLRHKNEVPRVINDVQKQNYEVRLFGEYWLGAGFAFGEGVFAWVPDGYDPKGMISATHGAHTEYQQFQVAAGSEGGGL